MVNCYNHTGNSVFMIGGMTYYFKYGMATDKARDFSIPYGVNEETPDSFMSRSTGIETNKTDISLINLTSTTTHLKLENGQKHKGQDIITELEEL